MHNRRPRKTEAGSIAVLACCVPGQEWRSLPSQGLPDSRVLAGRCNSRTDCHGFELVSNQLAWSWDLVACNSSSIHRREQRSMRAKRSNVPKGVGFEPPGRSPGLSRVWPGCRSLGPPGLASPFTGSGTSRQVGRSCFCAGTYPHNRADHDCKQQDGQPLSRSHPSVHHLRCLFREAVCDVRRLHRPSKVHLASLRFRRCSAFQVLSVETVAIIRMPMLALIGDIRRDPADIVGSAVRRPLDAPSLGWNPRSGSAFASIAAFVSAGQSLGRNAVCCLNCCLGPSRFCRCPRP
jgi:hypothetical protein